LKKKKQKNFNKETRSVSVKSFEGFGKLFQKFPKKILLEAQHEKKFIKTS